MLYLRKLFIINALISLVFGQCTKERAEVSLRRSVYEFSVELLSRIATDSEGHFVSSTLSPWTLLATISYGAADKTLDELTEVLKLSKHRCFNNKYLEIIKLATSSDPHATLERSSNIFIDDALGLKPAFRENVIKARVAEISPIYFDDFAVAAAVINNQVNSATHGVIEDIVSPSDLEGAYMILIDALYFKGFWRKTFSSEETEVSTFYDSQNKAIGDVNLMFNNGEFNITTVEVINAKVLELPYGDSGKYSMLMYLPNEGFTVYDVINSLKKISLGSIFKLFDLRGTSTVSVQIPRFKISSDLDNLKELLVDMGLHDAFDSVSANFPNISNFSIYISSLIQKADIEVTEEGTVAAAATTLEFSARNSIIPEEFVANKPFLFMVVDREAELPLFSGAYSKPTTF